MLAIAILQYRQILGGRRIWLLAVILCLPILLAVLIRAEGDLPRGISQEGFAAVFLYFMYPQSVSVVLALLYGTAILNTEIQQRTLTYLFCRPLSKGRIIVAKYLVNVAVLTAATLPSLTVTWMVFGMPGSVSGLCGQAIAVTVATLAFNAVFALFGVMFSRRAMVIGLIWAAIFEFVLSFVPAVVNTLTVTYHLRSVVLQVSGIELPREILLMVGDASIPAALSYPLGVAAVALFATVVLGSQREFGSADAA